MLRNYLLTALRIMLRQKVYSLINISGLSLGIAATLLILLYVSDELKYDKFHDGAERIYRVGFSGLLQGNEFNAATSPAPVAEAMQHEIPELEEVVRFGLWRTMPMSYEEKSFTEKHFLVADSNFFNFFSFELVAGDKNSVLKGTNKIVITESVARKYFGTENPIGKIMLRGSERSASEVSGIVKDPPPNSHIDFDIILSGESWEYMRNTQWTSNNLYTYIKVRDGAGTTNIETQLDKMVKKNMGSELEKYLGLTFEQFQAQGNRVGLFLQKLTDIHLTSNLSEEITPNGSLNYLYIFSAIAIFIVVIACINFMNLTTARSANRAKEVGVRKSVGALNKKLVLQFLAESILYSILSTAVSVLIVAASINGFNVLSGKQLSMDAIFDLSNFLFLVLFALVIGVLAGSYPAFYLTAFRPTEVLKGKVRAGMKNSLLRNSLVVFQFFFSITLIFGSFVVFSQLSYMQQKNLGFEKENVVSLLHTYSLGKNATAFKNDIASQPQFKGASFANRLPPNIDWNSAFRKGGSEQDFLLTVYQVDQDHLATMGYTLVQGRFFSRDFPTDTSAIILNETAYKQMAFTNLEEATIITYNSDQPRPLKVIGVLKDFNFENLKASVRPMAILLGPEPNFEMAIRLAPGNTKQHIELLESIWKKYAPEAPFEYSFLDQNFDALFRAEQRLSEIILVFTILAIGIACLGLFGLAAYTAEQRAKEIGIRKVMGASVSQLMIMLSKDFSILVAVAFLIAAPVGWFAAQRWLETFANRIDLEAWMILISGVISFLIAMMTISFQSAAAARENPVKAMRSE